MTIRWLLPGVALLAVLALAFSACGDDGAVDEIIGTPVDGVAEETPADAVLEETPGGGEDGLPAGDGDDEPAGDGTFDGGALDVDLCSIVTEGDVAALLDQAVTDVTEDPGSCTYTTETFGIVSLVVTGLGPDPENTFNIGRLGLQGEEVSGIGDEAYWVEEASFLNVRTGGVQLSVVVALAGANIEQSREIALQLAKMALEGLG
jgi:hypothetical protein